MLRQLRRQLAPMLAWVSWNPLARKLFHPAVDYSPFASPDVSEPPPSVYSRGAVSAPWRLVPIVSGGLKLAYPPVRHVPLPKLVRYPQLDDEPRVAGVYLRVYVGGANIPGDPALFLRSLVQGLHEEVGAMAAAHLMLTEGTLQAAATQAGVVLEGTSSGTGIPGSPRMGAEDVGDSSFHGVLSSKSVMSVDPSLMPKGADPSYEAAQPRRSTPAVIGSPPLTVHGRRRQRPLKVWNSG